MRKKNTKNGKVTKVSVIVPVYNAGEYIGQMLDSVLGQSMQEIEIICVNDGSTDNSGEIIRSFMDRDSRIMLLEQPNINAGAARNQGLLHARGKYVVFWDADDQFHRRALELMCRKMQRTQADICVCGVCEFVQGGKMYEADGYLKTEFIPDKDPFNKFDLRDTIFNFGSNMVWNKMFRRKFLVSHQLRFQEIRQANDTAFVMKAMFAADRITYVDRYLAFYRVDNADSLTMKSSETVFCPYESYLYTLQELEKEPEFALVKKGFRNKAAMGMFRALNIQSSFNSYEVLYDFLQREGFERLGLTECRKEDMEEEWVCTDLERIRMMSAEEFLLCKANERRMDRDQLKYTLRRVRRRLSVLLKVNQKLKRIKGLAGRK
ncbi:hypothetical protein C818_00703 [Lachnospiraceae bacterium MD308]|jgi:Glycosyltransferases involved in cell wall biogenesis|nr:hypothetical protein C818_00703 [Lachnospiraceae bacterium MD308]MCI8504254.1 glycosyltransferase family 2 protein [Dorea sp.]